MNEMKHLLTLAIIGLIFSACQMENQEDKTANEAFERNSKTVLANLEGWQNENLDYSMYAPDFVMLETAFGSEKDSVNLEEMKMSDKQIWATYDFRLLTDPPALLPGVNAETRKPDGSVRHYSSWEVTLPATDSTEARSGMIKLYESFDFNADGKIIYQQVYGDFTGLMMYLNQ
jgi:hypothetical protein